MVFPHQMSILKMSAQKFSSSDPVRNAVANKLELWNRAKIALTQKVGAFDGMLRRQLEAEIAETNGPELIEGFLAAADLVAELHRSRIALGPESIADPGSLICWLPEITEINLLDYGLLCECFASSYPHIFIIDAALDQLTEAATIALKLLIPLPEVATILSTQIPVDQWFDVIGDPVCNRIVPQAIRIPLSGVSMRAIQGQREQSMACAIAVT